MSVPSHEMPTRPSLSTEERQRIADAAKLAKLPPADRERILREREIVDRAADRSINAVQLRINQRRSRAGADSETQPLGSTIIDEIRRIVGRK